jgi:hypothetical protein
MPIGERGQLALEQLVDAPRVDAGGGEAGHGRQCDGRGIRRSGGERRQSILLE